MTRFGVADGLFDSEWLQQDPGKRVSVSRYGRAAELFGPIVDSIRKDVLDKSRGAAYQAALKSLCAWCDDSH